MRRNIMGELGVGCVAALVVGLLAAGCADTAATTDSDSGVGGSGGTTLPVGGTPAPGGNGGEGGDTPPVGGTGGGTPPVGGTGGTGGDINVGGNGGTGGDIPVGGTGGTGGDIPVGGTGGAGGEQPPPPPPTDDVAFSYAISALIPPLGDPMCDDHTGDGNADNAFGGVADLANGPLQQSIDEGQLTMLPTSIGLAPGAADGQLSMAVLTGQPDGAGGYTVDPVSLDADGRPLILFEGATVVGGRLLAGPGDFVLALPVQGNELVLQLHDTSIVGDVAVDNSQGLSINNGVISGVITQDDLNVALQAVDPTVAGLLPLFLQPDVDTDGNGSVDAYSLCLAFTAIPAVVAGYPVQ